MVSLLGLTLGLKGRYIVKSNRESGYGRYDIALIQIQDKEYITDLRQHGCTIVHLYGIHFDVKKVST